MAATERLKAEQAMAAARLAEATAQSSKETTKTVGAATVGAGNSLSKVLYMVQRQLLIGGHGLFFKLKIGNCEQSCVELEFQFTRDLLAIPRFSISKKVHGHPISNQLYSKVLYIVTHKPSKALQSPQKYIVLGRFR